MSKPGKMRDKDIAVTGFQPVPLVSFRDYVSIYYPSISAWSEANNVHRKFYYNYVDKGAIVHDDVMYLPKKSFVKTKPVYFMKEVVTKQIIAIPEEYREYPEELLPAEDRPKVNNPFKNQQRYTGDD